MAGRAEDGPVIENRLFVLVLQHPQERAEPRATAATLVAAVPRARLAVGLSWPNLSAALGGRRADPRRWSVLYLGSAQPQTGEAAAPARDSITVVRRSREMVSDPDRVLRSLEGIVLLDGTWSQAKTLWWRNPWLLKLHRLVLNPAEPARLGRIRREPRCEALSTLEAAAFVLRRLEPRPEIADALSAALDRLMGDLTSARPGAGGGAGTGADTGEPRAARRDRPDRRFGRRKPPPTGR
jgi:DTW domain-containing protein YfiP